MERGISHNGRYTVVHFLAGRVLRIELFSCRSFPFPIPWRQTPGSRRQNKSVCGIGRGFFLGKDFCLICFYGNKYILWHNIVRFECLYFNIYIAQINK